MEEREGKKMHSEQAADDIRVNELVKITEREAKDSGRDKLRDIPVTNRNYWKFRGEERRRLPRGIAWGVAGLVVMFIAGFAVSYYVAKEQIKASIAARAATLAAGVQDLQSFDPRGAAQAFGSLNASSSIAGPWGALLSFFGNNGPVHSFTDLSSQLVALSGELIGAENDMFSVVAPPASGAATGTAAFVPSGTASSAVSGGASLPGADTASTGTLLGDLKDIRATLGAIDADANQLSGETSYVSSFAAANGTSYLALKTQVEGAMRFLDAFIPWFGDASSTHHLLVLFENPSEMRPGGGFLGSYADVSLRGGMITGVAVHDIADVDRAFAPKIVPPVPLQLEETAWRPADANWFFDFPTSASETIALFGRSGLYANTSTAFDGAIAVTPQVFADLLSATGPITLPGAPGPRGRATASTTFAADNFITETQKIVQAGQAGSAGGNATYPKEVLVQLYQAMLQQLASSTPDVRAAIVQDAFDWIANKDVMAYFTDPSFESFVKAYGAAGDEYRLPQGFNGDYLAIANADVNSDKSEQYIAQKVSYQATIGADGTLTDHVEIDRTHDGNQSPYWWYRTTNQDYLQLYVPAGTALVNESGGILKQVPPPINYVRNGYSTDPLLSAIATDTAQIFSFPNVTTRTNGDKEVFGLWLRVPAGRTTKAVFDYSHTLFTFPAPGVQYEFVFERQSGAGGEYKIEIDAPLGYVFAENGLASFMYDSTSTPGRLTFILTLQKLQE